MNKKNIDKKRVNRILVLLIILLIAGNYKTIERKINNYFNNNMDMINLGGKDKKTNKVVNESNGAENENNVGKIYNERKEIKKYSSNKILVSNLKNKATKDELKRLMNKAQIGPKRQEQLFMHIDQFNSLDASSNLIGNYTKISTDENRFDESKLQSSWEKVHKDFTGYNCRITSMSIIGDYINFGKNTKSMGEDMSLAIDLDSINQDSSGIKGDKELDKFKKLFATVKVENTRDKSKMIAAQKKYWDSIGFNVSNKLASLVTVHFHTHFSDTENELFIGHAGILFEDGGKYYFFEKLAFQAPYRLVKLSSKKELKTYLLDKYSKLKGKDEAEPFIAINGEAI